MFKINFSFFILFIVSIDIIGQSVSKDLAQAVSLIHQQKYINGITPFQKYINSSPSQLIKESEPYLTDTLPAVRCFAYELINASAKKSNDKNVRQTAVFDLIMASKDKGAGIPGNTGKYLQQFNKDDFNSKSQDSIAAIINRGNGFLESLILISGYLQLSNLSADLHAVLSNKNQNDKTKWAAHLALARLDDSQEINYCINLLKNRLLNDAVVYNMIPGLIYTHQKAIYDYLITILNSNEKNCLSPNPDNGQQIICGYRMMEFLAPVIVGFPLQTIDGVNQIKTDNYDQALKTARSWFVEHKDNYIIKK